MPGTTDTFGIDYPCTLDDITLESLTTYATDVESALSSVSTAMNQALLRPGAVVSYSVGTPYTVGVAVIPSFGVERIDTDNMFTVAAPTVLTVNTAGMYLINFYCSSNMAATNTSHKGEILINGSPIAAIKGGIGVTGSQPINPLTIMAMASLSVGNTISTRVTVTGVGNDLTFPVLAAVLVSYGGF